MSTVVITQQQAPFFLQLMFESGWVQDPNEVFEDLLYGTLTSTPISVDECRKQCKIVDAFIDQLNDIVEPSNRIAHPHVEQMLDEYLSDN